MKVLLHKVFLDKDATLSLIALTTAKSCDTKIYVVPKSSFNCCNKFNTAACTETSKADVTSSHKIISGFAAKALATATLCFSPPDSCLGYLDV